MSLPFNFSTPSFGIGFNELARGKGNETGRETYEVGGSNFSAKRVFETDWATRHLFLVDFIGGVDSGGISIPPAEYPDVPQMRAVRAEVEGLGSPTINLGTNSVLYPFAVVTVSYTTTPSDQQEFDDRFSESLSFTSQGLTMPEQSFRIPANADVFDDDGNQFGTTSEATFVEAQPGKFMPTASYSLSARDIEIPPFDDILLTMGTVNEFAFTPLEQGISFAAGTLFFEGLDTERTTSINNLGLLIETWSFGYKWAFRRIPWNLVFSGLTSTGKVGWVKVFDGDGNPIFAEKNHDILKNV